MAPSPFSLPLARLPILSMKSTADKGVKELINGCERKVERASFYQTGVSSLRNSSRNSGNAVKVTLTALKRWYTKDKNCCENFVRSLNGNTDSLQKVVLSMTFIFFETFSLFEVHIVFEIGHYVRSHQWPAAQINFNCLFGEFLPCPLPVVSVHGL